MRDWLKKKHRTGKTFKSSGVYKTRTGNSNGKIKLSKAARKGLGLGRKSGT